MTEATGGITMTPPSEYYNDSVGKPLPGIELKLAEDNELLMRGPYVSPGYFKEEIEGSFKDEWFHTGDIFKKKKGLTKSKGGYYEKNIYSRGSSIAANTCANLIRRAAKSTQGGSANV